MSLANMRNNQPRAMRVSAKGLKSAVERLEEAAAAKVNGATPAAVHASAHAPDQEIPEDMATEFAAAEGNGAGKDAVGPKDCEDLRREVETEILEEIRALVKEGYRPAVQRGSIRASDFNPRKHFEERALEELAESLRTDGMVQPIVVRCASVKEAERGEFEIVCGERRFRAAKLAGLDCVPVIVRHFTRAQAIRVAGVENVQRKDINALEEALWFRTMLDGGGYAGGEREKKQQLAEEVGKSLRYVYQQLQLTTLIMPLQEMVLEGKLSSSHAALLCRLTEADQRHILKTDRAMTDYDGDVKSVRDLATWIGRELVFDLKSAPWKLDDVAVLPAAGTCVACPKRTGNCRELYPDAKSEQICTDGICFKAKTQAHIDWAKLAVVQKANGAAAADCTGSKRPLPVAHAVKLADVLELSSRSEWELKSDKSKALDCHKWMKAKKDCPGAKPGVIIDGNEIGQTIRACVDPKCKVCRAGSGILAADSYQAKERENRKKADVEKKYRQALMVSIIGHKDFARGIKKGARSTEDIARDVARFVLDRTDRDTCRRLFDLCGWKAAPGKYNEQRWDSAAIRGVIDGLGTAGCLRLMEQIRLAGELGVSSYNLDSKPELLLASAKEYGIDAGKLKDEVKAREKKK